MIPYPTTIGEMKWKSYFLPESEYEKFSEWASSNKADVRDVKKLDSTIYFQCSALTWAGWEIYRPAN